MTLRPDECVQRGLVSTTSRLLGEYETDGWLFTHAWGDHSDQAWSRWSEGPASRSGYVVAFQTPAPDPESNMRPEYNGAIEIICSFMAVLYGKRFDSHGLIESSGLFYTPELSAFGQLCDQNSPHNSHRVRVDYPVPLNLVEIPRIAPLLLFEEPDTAAATFEAAAKFYLRALQSIEQDREVAYLHLVTAGEVLSNACDYPSEQLLDEQTRTALDRVVAGIDGGEAIAALLSGRLRQIKRRFVRAIVDFVDPPFFDRREAKYEYAALKADSFEKTIAAAYDVRSMYLHTGVPFGGWMRPRADYGEVQLGEPVVEGRDFAKALANAPTFTGLERVVRYCLLRFAESQGLYLPPEAGTGDA